MDFYSYLDNGGDESTEMSSGSKSNHPVPACILSRDFNCQENVRCQEDGVSFRDFRTKDRKLRNYKRKKNYKRKRLN